jgi:uncharacterized membrane protein
MRRSKRTLKLGWRDLWPVWAVFGGLIAFGIVGLRIMFPTPTPPTSLKGGEDLTVNLSDLDPGKVRLFTYPVRPQTQVDFFVERGSSSDITVAFASCRRCYRSSHYERDGQILCGHCNEPMERLGAGQTPATEKDCKPIPIAFEKSGNQLVVRGDALRGAFARWYAPVLAQNARTPTEGKRGE